MGLVEQVTTFTGGLSIAQKLRSMNQQRRIRRMRRVVIASAESARDYLAASGERCRKAFVTLTYRSNVKWSPEHISDYLKAAKGHAAAAGFTFRYQWVLELTKKGRPHYHIIFWLPLGYVLRKPDASGQWANGMSNIKTAKNPVGYLVKYATKGSTAVQPLPKGARLFGCGGGTESEKCAAHRAGLPMWLSKLIPVHGRARKVPHCGWLSLATGEIFNTPYLVTWRKDDWGVVIVTVTHIGDLHDGFTYQGGGLHSPDSHDSREGRWSELPGEIADRDFACWQVRVSAQHSLGE